MARKILRKLFRFLGITLLILLVIGFVGYLILNKSLPEGQEGPEAEALAESLMDAVNADAWEDINVISWRFPRGHHFVWDRKRNFVEVKWDENRVLVAPKSGKGLAYVSDVRKEGEAGDELVKEGRHLFWNDSFWLCAFTKIKDPGTTRKVVDLEDEGKGLLVTYTSGGDTPGDSYLWKFDANGRPTAWQMWVNLIPIGGLEFSWEEWAPLHNGALVAFNHSSMVFDVRLTDIKSGDNLRAIDVSTDLFDDLEALENN